MKTIKFLYVILLPTVMLLALLLSIIGNASPEASELMFPKTNPDYEAMIMLYALATLFSFFLAFMVRKMK